MARTPDGPPPPPAVQRLRVRYAKRDRLRFSSHRDFQRALERALRRARVPMAYSAGFSPHPKISYANSVPTGAASEAEYVEIALTARREPEAVRAALDAALPPGLDVVEVVEAGPGGLADRLTGSLWQVELPGARADDARRAVADLLALQSAPVQRLLKNGRRTLDVRAAVVLATVAEAPATAGDAAASAARPGAVVLHLVLRHLTPSVRPDDVVTALGALDEPLVLPQPARALRRAQGTLDEVAGTVSDPLEPDRTSASAATG